MSSEGAWIAYYSDGSSFAVFATEIEAYRYALPVSMSVTFLPYGVRIEDHERNQHVGQDHAVTARPPR